MPRVNCHKCGKPVVVELERRNMWRPSGGVGTGNYVPLKPDAFYYKTCPHCGAVGSYRGREFKEAK